MVAKQKQDDISRRRVPTVTHWGNYEINVEDDKIVGVENYAEDPHPSPIGQSLNDSQNPNVRIDQPMVRRSYLETQGRSDGSKRGREAFVAVSWDDALDLAAQQLQRVKTNFGNASIYAGSYGWSSAGRFHHAQSQIHRFLKQFGGYTASDKTYSAAAGETLLPHIFGSEFYNLFMHTTPWTDVRDHGDVVLCFSGVSPKNLQAVMGGIGAHTAPDQLRECANAGVKFINVSPIRGDLPDYLNAEWIPIRPTTDTALMLAICHTLLIEGHHDEAFLNRYCVGFERFRDYLLGNPDGVTKSAKWAAPITTIPEEKIVELARTLAGRRTFVPIGWSLQRAEHGEQTYWASAVLVAMLGQYGLPGGGIGHGVGSLHAGSFNGHRLMPFRWASFPQGDNPIDSVIPVARVSDLLLNPGQKYNYDGQALEYPDIRLVYWAGGNPFHHHQDLNRLREAWQRPECVIVNEQVWSATARHADIVFPVTMPVERNDVALSFFDHYISPMPQCVPPFGQARNDYDIFSGLAERLGFLDAFTEGKNEMQWVRTIYDESRKTAASNNVALPDFEKFWHGNQFSIAEQLGDSKYLFELFRDDPEANRLGTPSGRIEIFSKTIDAFGYEDCPGHPVWLDKEEWLGAPRATKYPLHLISNQPATRLHSQFDFGTLSRDSKVKGREPITLHPDDAALRGIAEGDIVRVYNDRGACLAGVKLSEHQRRSVVQLSTGAWFDPIDTEDGLGLDVHGNPNVLTRDVGTSQLGQGPTAHSCLVEVEPYLGKLPDISVFSPPEIIRS